MILGSANQPEPSYGVGVKELFSRINWWLVILFAVLGMVMLWPAQASLIGEGRDIRQDYIAARRFFVGSDLYTPFTDAELASIAVNPDLGMPRNFHPPSTLVFFAPLALLNFKWAVVMWGIVTLGAFFTSVHLIMRELGYGKWMFVVPAAIWWFPLWLHVRFGQFSVLTLLFLTLFWLSIRRNRQNMAGVWLALACLIKLFPLMVLLLLFLKRQWKALASALFVIGIATAAILAYYPESLLSFFARVAPDNALIFRSYFGNFSLNGFIGRLFHGTAGISPLVPVNAKGVEEVSRFVGLALVGIVLLIYVLRVKDYDLCFSIIVVAMLIVSPVTWAHSFTILLLPGLILWRRLSGPDNQGTRVFAILLFLFSCFPHWQYYEWLRTISPGQLLPAWLLLTSPGFYVLIGVFALIIWQGGKCALSSRLEN